MSLMPQFIKPEFVNGPAPFLILGFTFITTGTIWCLFIAYAASYMTNKLRKNEKISKVMHKVSGTVFIALGLQLLIDKKFS